MRILITLQQRSENGYEFYGPGLKTVVKNDTFWSEIGSGFGEPGDTPLPRIPRSTPPVYMLFECHKSVDFLHSHSPF